ncbi:MAG: carboxypeptidase regulatory-like domain-containing protein [Bacteroidetes bacterium]|nr:carboxypeptidase regulatory-like domain-containing protein [Bacteroidota bacterium]
MNSEQLARYKAYRLALAHLKENESVFNDKPAFVAVYQSATSAMAQLDEAEQIRLERQSGATHTKNEQRDQLARLAFTVSNVLVSHAVDTGDTAIRKKMSFNLGELQYLVPQRLIGIAANILDTARRQQQALQAYGLSEEQLNELADRINQFSETAQGPRKFITERMQAGMRQEELLEKLDTIFNEQLDGLMLLYQEKQREFYDQYMLKRTVVKRGRRKTRVYGQVTDKATAAPLENVTVAVKGTAMSTLTAPDGSYSMNTPSFSIGVVVYSKEGYTPVEITTSVKRGQATNNDMSLEKVHI